MIFQWTHSDEDPFKIFSHNDLELTNNWKLTSDVFIEKNIIKKFNYSFNPNLFMRVKRKLKI